VVKQSGGYISVDSQLGQGASFQIFLPLVDEDVSRSPRIKHQAESLTGSETVLLVEDAEPLRKLARSFLIDHGFKVLVASDGNDALGVPGKHPGALHPRVTAGLRPRAHGRGLASALPPRTRGLQMHFTSTL